MAEGRFGHDEGLFVTGGDRFRTAIIERIMCDFIVDRLRVSHSHGRNPEAAWLTRSVRATVG
jgi:oxygen-independent coproporphyrinogen-3 oxidase